MQAALVEPRHPRRGGGLDLLPGGPGASARADQFALVQAKADSPQECLVLRDALYTQWAGFVGFLIEVYGVEAVLSATRLPAEWGEVGRGGRVRESQLDYVAAFGVALEDLENEWLGRLLQE